MRLQNLREIADKYDSYLIDQWGVLHNGVEGFAWAQEALAALKAQGKQVIVLSNSSQPKAVTEMLLERLGYEPSRHYDDIITSGSDFQDSVLEPQDEFYRNLGKKCYLIAWQRETDSHSSARHAVLCDLPVEVVDAVDEADFILCAGIDRGKALEDYLALLKQAAKRSCPMVCINPDKFSVAPDGSIELCPGGIAAYYEQKYQGSVRWHGKPYPPVYESAARLFGHEIDTRVLGVGDSLHHDIQGIKHAGGDALFLTSGIAWQELGLERQYDDAPFETVLRLFQQHLIFGDYAQTKLEW